MFLKVVERIYKRRGRGGAGAVMEDEGFWPTLRALELRYDGEREKLNRSRYFIVAVAAFV